MESIYLLDREREGGKKGEMEEEYETTVIFKSSRECMVIEKKSSIYNHITLIVWNVLPFMCCFYWLMNKELL